MVLRRPAGIVLVLGIVLSGGVRADGAQRGAQLPVPAATAAVAVSQVVAAYEANVRASGQVIVTFHGDHTAGCDVTGECDVQSGTMTWTPPSSGSLEVLDFGSKGRPRLRALLGLSGIEQAARAGSTSVQRAASGGVDTCIDTAAVRGDTRLRVTDDASGGLTFGLYATRAPVPLLGVPQTPFDLAYELEGSASAVDEPAPTHCGGPLPADFLPSLPARAVPLSALRRGASTVDLSGVSTFAAGGLAGTARSSIVLHVRRLRSLTVHRKPRPTPMIDEDRVISVEYRVAKVAGTIAVRAAADPSTCAAFAACGLDGSLTVRPGPGQGTAYVIAYDVASTSGTRLRRAVGLASGKIPRYAQVSGLATWTSTTGTVSAAFERGGSPACRDVTPLPLSALELNVKGGRAIATFGGTDYADLAPIRDLLRTRCPGPLLSDLLAHNAALATSNTPISALGQRTLTLRLTHGTTVRAPGFTWRSLPALTIMLQRVRVTETLVPSSAFYS